MLKKTTELIKMWYAHGRIRVLGIVHHSKLSINFEGMFVSKMVSNLFPIHSAIKLHEGITERYRQALRIQKAKWKDR